jgi:tetratricopeptide (TPR) repeat protein
VKVIGQVWIMSRTLRDVIEESRRRRFTDRKDERDLFSSLLDQSHPELHVIALHGLAGIGKSTLLDELVRMCQERKVPFARIDGTVHRTIILVASAIRKQLSTRKWWSPFRQFDDDLRKYLEIQGKIEKSGRAQQLFNALSGVVDGADPSGLYGKLGKEAAETGFSALHSYLTRPDIDFYIQANELLAQRLVDCIGSMKAKKLTIMIDDYEQIPEDVQTWIEQRLTLNIGENTALVIASESRLSGPWVDLEAAGIMRQIELESFNKPATIQMLESMGISEQSFADEVFSFTRGHPLCIALAAEHGVAPGKKYIVVRSLIERVFDGIDEPQRVDLIERCSIPRRFNQDVIDHLCSEIAGSERDIAKITAYSFARSNEGGYSIHDTVREYVNDHMAKVSPGLHKQLHTRAFEYFRGQLTKAESMRWSEYAAEALYHQLVLSEQKGVDFCIELFSISDSTYDLQLGAALIHELEQFPFKDDSWKQWAMALKARYSFLQRDWSKAAEQHYSVLQHVNEPELRLLVLNGLALVLAKLNRLDESVVYAEQAIALAEKIKSSDGLLDALYSIGLAWQRQGHFQKAILRIEDRIPQDTRGHRVAFLIEMLGFLYLSLGRLKQASRYYRRALDMWQELDSRWRVAASQLGIASVLCRQEGWSEAIDILDRALHVYESLGDTAGTAVIMSKLAEAKLGAGDISSAIELATRSISINEEVGSTFGLTLDHCRVGSAYFQMSKYKEALKHFQRSLDYAKEGGNRALEASAELELTKVYLEMNDEARAREHVQAAIEIAETMQLENIRNEGIELRDRLK